MSFQHRRRLKPLLVKQGVGASRLTALSEPNASVEFDAATEDADDVACRHDARSRIAAHQEKIGSQAGRDPRSIRQPKRFRGARGGRRSCFGWRDTSVKSSSSRWTLRPSTGGFALMTTAFPIDASVPTSSRASSQLHNQKPEAEPAPLVTLSAVLAADSAYSSSSGAKSPNRRLVYTTIVG